MLLIGLPLQLVGLTIVASISELHAQGRLASLQRLLRDSATLAVIPALIALLALLVFGDRISALIFGPYYAAAGTPLRLLCLGQIAFVCAGSAELTLIMTGRQRIALFVNLGTTLALAVGGTLSCPLLRHHRARCGERGGHCTSGWTLFFLCETIARHLDRRRFNARRVRLEASIRRDVCRNSRRGIGAMTTVVHLPEGVTASARALPASVARHLASLLVVAYCGLVPVIIVPIGGESFSLCEPLLLLSAITLFFVRPLAPPRIHHIAMALYLAATLISLWQIHDSELLAGSAKRWVRLVAIAVPLYLPLGLAVSRRQAQRANKAFLWGGLLAIAIGLVLFWLQIPIREESQKLWLGNGHAAILRASGLVADTAAFGHLVAVWAIVALGYLWIENVPRRLGWSFVVGALVLYAVVVSSSRGALIDIVAGLFTLCILKKPGRRIQKNHAVLGLLVAMAAAVGFAGLMFASNLQGPPGEIQGSLSRFLGGNSPSINTFSSGRLENWSSYLSECGLSTLRHGL